MQPTILRPSATSRTPAGVTKTSVLLWTIQGVLAALFLFAGGMKLILPIAEMTKQMPLPGPFLRFIGVIEVAGGLGLVLPGILHLRAALTPLAAAGLVGIMFGATGVTLASGQIAGVIVPVVVGLLAAFVAYARWQVAPYRQATHDATLRRAA